MLVYIHIYMLYICRYIYNIFKNIIICIEKKSSHDILLCAGNEVQCLYSWLRYPRPIDDRQLHGRP